MIADAYNDNGVYGITGATYNSGGILLYTSDNFPDASFVGGTVYLLPANRCQLIFGPGEHGFIRENLAGRVQIHGVSLWGGNGADTAFLAHGPEVAMQLSHVVINGFDYGLSAAMGAVIDVPAGNFKESIYMYGGVTPVVTTKGGMINVPWGAMSWADSCPDVPGTDFIFIENGIVTQIG